jgi:hypothetical protein
MMWGGVGFMLPCNRYATARVTWCGPGIELGWSVFNITYDAFSASFESRTIPCTPSSTHQMLSVCYPLRDPGAFAFDAVMFEDPRTAPAFVIGGAVAFAAGVALAWHADRRERSRERSRELERALLADAKCDV